MNLPPPPPPPPNGWSHHQPKRKLPTPLKGLATWIGVFFLVALIDGVLSVFLPIDIGDGIGFTLALVLATVATVRVMKNNRN